MRGLGRRGSAVLAGLALATQVGAAQAEPEEPFSEPEASVAGGREQERFEAVILGWSLSRDPDLYDIWHSSKTKEGEFNFISYSNPEVDRLLTEGRRTFDMEERKRIYRRVHALLAEDQPYTFLFVPDSLPILHKRFKGVEQTPIGIFHDFVRWQVPDDRARWYE